MALNVIPSKRSLRSEGSGRAARSVAFVRRNNRAFGSLPHQTASLPHSPASSRVPAFLPAGREPAL